MTKLIIFLSLVTFQFVSQCQSAAIVESADDTYNKCWSNGNGQSTSKWWPSGAIIVRGSYFYECQQGQLLVRGCLDPSGRQLQIGQTYIKQQKTEMKCTMGNTGNVFFDASACVVNGQPRRAGETWQTDKFYYECNSKSLYGRTYLTVKKAGCMSQGRRLKIGDIDERQDGSWYECKTGARLRLGGCMNEGRRMRLTEDYTDGEFAYTCATRSGKAVIMTTNCVYRNERLNSGDRYFKDGTVYQCDILYDAVLQRTTREHKLVGCVEKDPYGAIVRERVLGCQWYNDAPECRYEYRCGAEGKVEEVGCSVLRNGVPYLFVPANKYTIYYFRDRDENLGVGCRKDNTGRMNYFEFQPNEVGSKAYGLSFTAPRGKK